MKLNLGCGKDYRKGYINIDNNKNFKTDKIFDLNQLPYPFEDDSVDEIIANEILEHLDDVVKVMREIWRICKNNAIIKIKVPYYKWRGAFWDPTHKHFFTEETFYYFTPNHSFYIEGYPKFRILSMKFIGGKIRFWQKRHLLIVLKPVK